MVKKIKKNESNPQEEDEIKEEIANLENDADNLNELALISNKDNIKGDNILDLYCGVGTLSIVASKNAKKVYGIEIIPNAIINALKNAKFNKADNVEFILGKVEDKIEFIKDNIDPIIVDPLRKG